METKREGRDSGEAKGVVLSEEQLKRRRLRNYAIGLAVVLFMALIYAVTIIRLGGGASHPPS
ncbi:MAG TPA: hypothetical protein VEH76_06530 [Methylocystis sp.]|nr:hypothetical protein [Methylocystis sp.]